jgi:hypothetical protein
LDTPVKENACANMMTINPFTEAVSVKQMSANQPIHQLFHAEILIHCFFSHVKVESGLL